jgi:hypothetical protein
LNQTDFVSGYTQNKSQLYKEVPSTKTERDYLQLSDVSSTELAFGTHKKIVKVEGWSGITKRSIELNYNIDASKMLPYPLL